MKTLKNILFYIILFSGVLSTGLLLYDLLAPITVIAEQEAFYLTPREVEEYTRLAEEGDSHAAFKLFDYYTFWRYDGESSKFWLQKSAELGDEKAKILLRAFKRRFVEITIFMGRCYHLPSQEIKENIQLAENGDSDAALKLWKHYYFWASDRESAMVWLKRSADLGNETAKHNLSILTGQNADGGSL